MEAYKHEKYEITKEQLWLCTWLCTLKDAWQESAKHRPCVCVVNDDGTVEQICAAHDALIVAERKLIADELLEKAERSAVSLKGKRLYSAEGIVMRKIADRLNKRTRH